MALPEVVIDLFSSTHSCSVQHNGKGPEKATDYLRRHKVKEYYLDLIFGQNGEFDYIAYIDAGNINELSIEDLKWILRGVMNPIHEIVEPSLDNGHPYGFHKHDIPHVDKVRGRTLKILQNAGYDEQVQRLGIFSAETHDSGNMLSRSKHPEISIQITKAVFRDFLDSKQWDIVSTAILNHEISNAKANIIRLINKHQRSVETTYQALLEEYGPITWALILADKTDVGIDRVSEKALANYWEASQQDPYVVKDAAVTHEELNSDGQIIDFNPTDLRQNFNEKITFEQWVERFMELDYERILLSAISHFTLYPEHSTYTVSLIDAENSNTGERETLIFTREDVLRQIYETHSSQVGEHQQQIEQIKTLIPFVTTSLQTIDILEPNESLTDSSITYVGDGAFSSAFRIEYQSKEVIFKTLRSQQDVPFADLTEYAEHLTHDMRDLPGVVKTYGLYAINENGSLIKIEKGDKIPPNLQFVFSLQEAMPKSAKQMLQVLGQYGLRTIQDDRLVGSESSAFIGEENLVHIYHQIIERLAIIHASAGENISQATEEYPQALQSIVTDRTRFDGVASCLPAMNTCISQDMVNLLRYRMLSLAEINSQRHNRQKPVHGDAWASNFFIGDNNELYIIDPGRIERSDPALDVVFTTGDLALVDINRADGIPQNVYDSNNIQLADRLVDAYQWQTGDNDIRFNMALFFGYKAFVAAVFDAGTNEKQRYDLYCVALGCVDLANQNPNMRFSYQFLNEYAQRGREIIEQEI